ncbi:MAG: hypothetical protein H0T75_17325, partial [Rhizobiales bacterium]|nr:hypothetical protein [Hyphomicrobiales bacterium]
AGRKAAGDIAQILGDEHDLCLLAAGLAALRVPGKLRDVRDRLREAASLDCPKFRADTQCRMNGIGQAASASAAPAVERK